MSSPAFRNGEGIPAEFTCEGRNEPPPLQITDLPEKTVSLALVCEDPDAPSGAFVHWLLWNLPPGADISGRSGTAGMNDFGRAGYGGPCPPRGHGAHRYFFTLFALDTMLSLGGGSSKEDLEGAMEGHVLAKAGLMGTFERL